MDIASSLPMHIDGWEFRECLGEGSYGEVRRAVNNKDESIAIKCINTGGKGTKIYQDTKKEVMAHSLVKHEYIIACYGLRNEENISYIFLEYAAGGELFDRIEPDVGMPAFMAQRYFQQLISAVEYMHSRGVTHRDIKPENLLLNDRDILKVSDFGFATVFRHRGRERKLDKCCGTKPYVAPEVLSGQPYWAAPADVWSCAVVLVAMLCGELPWDEPAAARCPEYRAWLAHEITLSPWAKLANPALSLVRKVLVPEAAKRYTLADIRRHQWFRKRLRSSGNLRSSGMCSSGQGDLTMSSPPGPPAKQQRRSHGNNNPGSPSPLGSTQPDPEKSGCSPVKSCRQPLAGRDIQFFSQPEVSDNMILPQSLSTQHQLQSSQSQYGQCGDLEHMVKRFSRFLVSVDVPTAIGHLSKAATKAGCQSRKVTDNLVTVTCSDRRRNNLIFRVACYCMSAKEVLLDFRLSRGDGLEFKRKFRQIKDSLGHVISCYSVPIDLQPTNSQQSNCAAASDAAEPMDTSISSSFTATGR